MIILKIAFRNVFRQKRRSLLTIIMMAGGYFLFSLSIGVSDGTYSSIIDMFTRDHTGHIQIHRKGYLDRRSLYKTISNYEALGSRIEAVPEVQAWAPRLYSPALAFIGTKTTGVRIIGIDPEREARTTRLREKVSRGRFISGRPLREVVIGSGLARILNADIGDELVLISQGADGSIANDLFNIVGFAGSARDTSERMNCYMHIKTAQEFLVLDNRIHEIAIVLTDQRKSREIASLIRRRLNDPSLDVEPWQVVEKQFYQAMQADVKGTYISLLIIMIIVAVGVLNTVLMTILERTHEFGLLRALGTRPVKVFLLIMIETGVLSVFGVMLGGVFGVLGNYLLSIYGISYPVPIEYGGIVFEKMVGMVSLKSILLPAAVTVLTALVVSVFPAIRAARVEPVKAMRSI
ncbi:hypothetical protein MNBD_NITROSPIRAE03-1381 [hydrothermal vent metagenome]|uniref:ABC transporter permease n=1 Tax=hydrothermal vent metagenome TaxID=652676 RepID=A0A3B1DCW8_9ZZZZ